MLHITLGEKRATDPAIDGLGRSCVGFDESMTADDLYTANRGCWVLGARADQEDYALVSFGGTVRQAIAITAIVPTRGGRRALEGKILEAGDPVFDTYVGKPSPVSRVRNPITYFAPAVGQRLCACGCDGTVEKGAFLPGHDQRAIHARVSKVGTVVDFIEWFDATYDADDAADGAP